MPQPAPSPLAGPAILDRRRLLQGFAAVGAGLLVDGAAARPGAAALVRSGRPTLTHGVQSGDVTASSAVVWARADRLSRMVVELAATESFAHARRLHGPVAGPATDFTAHLDLRGLPPGHEVFYRVWFRDLHDQRLAGEPVAGRFRTAPAQAADVAFAWSGDTAGQGWGINPDFGGMRMYETIRAARPDFFLHSGDSVYADGPIAPSVALPGGGTWRNLTTEEKSKVAETLREFRGNYRYNLLDENVLRCNAEVPVLAQWDDHETRNNWWPGQLIEDDRYTKRRADVLAARARRAFLEYMPLRPGGADEEGRIYRVVRRGPTLDVFLVDMRTYRGPNTANDQPAPGPDTAFLGRRQLRWLQRELARSRATWKVIAADMPIGLVVPDGAANFEAIAQGAAGTLGRELEIAELLSFIARRRIANVVWLTADVHYTAAHHYHPDRASFQDFTPFWEFVSGPLNAGTFGPNALDPTFGPEVVFQKVPDAPNLPPSAGLQFFGHVTVAGASGVMTVRLRDLTGATLWSIDLDPA